jgi:serine/threonine-protein kinase
MDQDRDPTLPQEHAAWEGDEALADEGRPEARYLVRHRLGWGGMGEVRLCEDRRIGREVAMKTAHGTRDARQFISEARIQARLEHPSIVPVYDVGRTEDGAPYFTMKRVHGVTLKRILARLRDGDAEMRARYSRRRLLTAFANVCLVVHYAHTHDVFHRDLKPSNIMLDEYGELYVLDWGLAHLETRDDPPDSRDSLSEPSISIGGTPRYMSPEQIRGEAAGVEADVYSLGAVLFEILALQPLHRSKRRGPVDARPSVRAPERDIAPELDAICVRATKEDPRDRYPSARALHDAVDRFLEGDRDLERRRELAKTHASLAEELAASAGQAEDSAAEASLRSRAMSEASRSLAFEPDNAEARRVVLHLLTVPPRKLPDDAREEMERRWHVQRTRMAKLGAALFLSWFVAGPLLTLITPVRAPWFTIVHALCFAAAAGALIRVGRAPFGKAKTQYPTLVCTSLAIATLSAYLGPLILVPTIVVANCATFLLQPVRSSRAAIALASCAAVVIPLAMEWLGLVPPSYRLDGQNLIVVNRWAEHDAATLGILVGVTVALVLAVSVLFSRFRQMLTDAETRLSLLAWHLRQLVPPEGGGSRAS